MPKPFANSAQITYSLVNGDWLLGIQTGNSTGDAGLPQMKHIKLSQLSDWVRGTYGQIWRYRGPFSASLPSDPQANDYFLATATFTVDGVTYTKDHLYAYSASGAWDDISDVLTQYASQAQVTDIDDRLTVAEEKIDSMGDGIIFKGECTYAELLAIQNPEAGWEYYVTDKEAFYLYSVDDGWVETAGTVVQTPDETDITHALSNAVTTQIVENAKGAGIKANHRIDNMKDIEGSYDVQNYKDGSITPSGKGNWAVVEGLRGVSRVENNQAKSVNGTNWVGNLLTPTFADGVATFTASSQYAGIYQPLSLPANRNYLLSVEIKTTTATNQIQVLCQYTEGTMISVYSSATTGWQKVSIVGSPTNDLINIMVRDNRSSGWDAVQMRNPILTDLNVYFGTSDLSFLGATNAEKLATIQKDYPHLLTPSEYGVRIVDSSYSGVRAWARNLWDEQWKTGTLNVGNGEDTASTQYSRSVDYIPCLPSTTYYGKTSSNFLGVLFYGMDKTYIAGQTWTNGTNRQFTSIANAYYMRFVFEGQTYNHDICINKSDSLDGTYTPYHAPQTLSLTFQGKSAGSVAEEYYPESGEVTHPIGTKTYSANDVREDTSAYTNVKYFYVNKPSNSRGINTGEGYGFTTKYLVYPNYRGAGASSWDDAKCIGNCFTGFIYSRLYFGFAPNTTLEQAKAQIDGLIFQYELKEADPSTFVTPIIDNTLLTEAGGRMATVQTGTVVDGSFDMGFYAEKSQLQEKLEDGTIVVGKAQKDASGNVITSTYATKSELTSEATARANADSNLLAAIENTTVWDIDQEAEVIFEGDGAGTWEIMERQIPTESNDGIFLCMDASAPSNSSSAGLKGQFYMDENYLYLCIANNTWRRVALSTF